jgi:hypothetical protein
MKSSMRGSFTVVALAGALTVAGLPAIAEQPPSGGQAPTAATPAQGGERGQGPGQGRGEGRGRGGGMRGAAPLSMEDRTGFESIFDGTMKGWDADPTYWKAEGGSLVGESTAANPVKANTFVIWRGGEPADFELKLEFRMNSTNSGIQFRSQQIEPGSPSGRGDEKTGNWVLKGYQADIDYNNQFTGMIYEERGRGFLMQRGQAVYIGADGSKKVIGHLEMTPDQLKGMIKPGDWNHVHLIARGNTLMNIVNGNVTAVIVDDDEKGRAMKGLIGFQIHTGPPMKIEFRNIYLKKL